MRLTRVHVKGPLAAGSEITLPSQAGEHLTRVLRLEAGAPCVLFDGNGGEYAARLAPRNGKSVRVQVLEHRPVERESPLDITLLQGIARGERMDLIVQKATELGVARIVPVLAERSVVRIDAQQRERKREHWQSVVVSACEQSGRNRVPAVAPPCSLGDATAGLADSLRVLLSADAPESLVACATRAGRQNVALLVGPEGGLADHEEKFALSHQFVACRLGARVLRTETAGFAALAALQAIAGDFRA